ncbi:MAG: PQQ-binding-like beta-propeller repeat protein [Holosporales bacterium]|nr:PQQ-binding-like beta-propeller repeat protein [Holosporales bacterium]
MRKERLIDRGTWANTVGLLGSGVKPADFLRMHKLFAAGCIGCFLSSCSSDPKITGHRELFIPMPMDVPVDHTISQKPVTIPICDVQKWPQHHFSCTNELVNAKFDVSKAKLLWKMRVGSHGRASDKLLANMVAANGVLFCCDAAGGITAIDVSRKASSATKDSRGAGARNKKVIWHANVAGKIDNIVKIGGLAVLGSGDLVVATAKGGILKLSATTGEIKKTAEVRGIIRSAPCVYTDKNCKPCGESGAKSTKTSHGSACSDRIIIQTSRNNVVVLDSNLKVQWEQTETSEDVAFLAGASPATNGNVIVSAFSSGEYKAYDFFSNNEKWENFMTSLSQDETAATVQHICASPVISDGVAIILGSSGNLVANHIVSNRIVWKLPLSGLVTPAVSGDWVFMIDNSGRVFCIEKKTGKIKCRAVLPANKEEKAPEGWTAPILAGNAVVVVSDGGKVVFFDVNSGKIVRVIESRATNPVAAIVVDEVLFVSTKDGELYAFGG